MLLVRRSFLILCLVSTASCFSLSYSTAVGRSNGSTLFLLLVNYGFSIFPYLTLPCLASPPSLLVVPTFASVQSTPPFLLLSCVLLLVKWVNHSCAFAAALAVACLHVRLLSLSSPLLSHPCLN
ncbi:MAG: hypothetical protein JOS17DRAFT_768847, partial [Linnemannia elongata]